MKRRGIKSSRGQVKMSFGMIFSIILIVVFIAFAIYGIHKFLSLQSSINSKQFVDSLQGDVTSVWNEAQATRPETYTVPSSVAQVCFTNSTSENLIFITDKNNVAPGGNIEHLNMTSMIKNGDLCFNVTSGKVSFTIRKDFGETLVTIK